LCRTLVEMLEVEPGSRVADICCGKGSFFNYLDGCELHGVEKDPMAHRVCARLFPSTSIECADMRAMQPIPDCDYILGNPPFVNLAVRSHPLGDEPGMVSAVSYYLERAEQSLRPDGFIAFICPDYHARWLVNAATRRFFDAAFSSLAEVRLPRGTFPGVNIRMKAILAQKKGRIRTNARPLALEFNDRDEVLERWRASTHYRYFRQLKELSQRP
jgi:trans-aconitate methyltransferase